jgi:polyhydroxyalkanoate synthesis regulator phasin
MSENVENAVFNILKKIQGDISAVRLELAEFKRGNSAEHERMEAMIRGERRDSAGSLLLTRTMFGDLNERVTDLEQRMTKLEDHEQRSS